jgi:hypothetical protein
LGSSDLDLGLHSGEAIPQSCHLLAAEGPTSRGDRDVGAAQVNANDLGDRKKVWSDNDNLDMDPPTPVFAAVQCGRGDVFVPLGQQGTIPTSQMHPVLPSSTQRGQADCLILQPENPLVVGNRGGSECPDFVALLAT